MVLSRLRVLISGDNSSAIRAINQTRLAEQGLWRDRNGYLRDAQGRFAAGGIAAGNAWSRGFQLGLRGFSIGLTGMFTSLTATLTRTVSKIGLGVVALAGIATVGKAAIGVLGGLASGTQALGVAAGAAALGLGALGAGLGAFGLLAGPSLAAAKKGMDAYAASQDAIKAAEAAGDVEALNRAYADQAAAMATLSPLQQQMAGDFLSLRDTWRGLSTELEPVTAGLVSEGTTLLKDFLPTLLPVAQQIGAAISEVFGRMRNELNTPLFQDTWDEIGRLGSSLTVRFGDMAIDGMQAFGAGLIQASPLIEDVFGRMAGSMSRFADYMASDAFGDLVAWAQDALPHVTGMFGDLGETVGALFRALRPLLVPVTDMIGRFAQQLSAVFESQGMQDFIGEVIDIMPLVAETIGSLAGAAGDLLRALEPLGPVVVTAIGALADGLGRLFSSDSFSAFIDGLIDALPILVEGLLAVGTALVDGLGAIGPALPDLVRALGDMVIALSPGFVDLVAALVDTLLILAPQLPPLATAFSDILTQVSPLLPELGQLVAKLAELATDVLTPMLENGTLERIVVQLVDLTDSVLQLLDAVGPGLEILGQLLVVLGDMASLNLSLAADILTGIADAIREVWETADQLLHSSGQDIVKGLVNGILSMQTLPARTLLGIGEDMLNSFADFFRIKSPSRVMMEMGGHLNQGLANGLTGSLETVEGAWGKTTGLFTPPAVSTAAVVAPIAGAAASQMGASAGTSGTVIHNTFHISGPNADEVVEKVMTKLDAQQKAVGINVRMVTV